MPLPHKTEWFVNGESLGEGICLDYFRDTCIIIPRSIVWICPIDGEIWGRIIVKEQKYIPNLRACELHGGGRMIPLDKQFNIIPPRILKREILLISKKGKY